MERVPGIGGHFMRAADPVALGAWYRDCLGLDADENGLWGVGRFGRVADPEGNRIELWQPA
ncbi:VOC family protein [Streptomyces lavendulae]|uniref:VOC family protein n=1 Tax=Streptomyces lavendulae TaxID=1914 RepID=UPI0036E364F7